MSTYERVQGLPLVVDSLELERRELVVSSDFTRVTTVVRLRGSGEEGLGEDVTYTASVHDTPPALELAGRWESLEAFSRHLEGLPLFAAPPEQAVYVNYRRWAYESAALDLALRQAGLSLAEALGREPRPVRFVVSMRLPEPPTAEPLRLWVERDPGLRFKLDPTSAWDEELVAELARMGAVDTVDLKGAYRGTPVDNPASAELYQLVAEGLPQAWIEDPDLDDPAAAAALEPHRARITWDAPIHLVADIGALPYPPRTLNIKPSRFGSVRALFAAYDLCAERGIGMYGGGQFEIGPGRGQIQYLASLFHPDTPNDVAPSDFNVGAPRAGLARSPLPAPPAGPGFRWG